MWTFGESWPFKASAVLFIESIEKFQGIIIGQELEIKRDLPSFVLSLSITETSEIISTIRAKLHTMLTNVRPRSNPVRRRHQFGFLIKEKTNKLKIRFNR